MSTPWQRPSTCTAGGCPEVRAVGGRIVIRDSARPAEEVWFRPGDFAALVRAAKAGEYDHLTNPTEETPALDPLGPCHACHAGVEQCGRPHWLCCPGCSHGHLTAPTEETRTDA